MRRMGRKDWRKRFPGPTFFITGKDKGKLGYFWEHVYLKAKSGPNLGGVVNPDSGVAILDSEMQKLTALDFTDKLKVSEALTAPCGGTTRFSALWQADRTRIQRMAPIEYIGRYMRGWFDFAIADELHQLAGDTAQGNGLGVLGRAAQRLTEPENLTREALYAKERALIADVKEELRQGRRCQVYATYTGEKDVTLRLEAVLRQEGIRVAILRSSVATDKREDWYERQLKAGVQVVICHPKLVETGLDLLAFPTLYFYETGYSLHTLRQASRRSWRIGQRFPVRVKFVTYSGTMQETCLRLMGKKMLVALMMEGKFSGEGLQALDTDEDLMSAMARELVEKAGVGESADAIWRDLGHEREKVLPRPTSVEPESEEESELAPDLPGLIAAELAPAPFGIHLIEPTLTSKKRKKAAIWPTATETNAQLSLFD
jgi:hypothetical protein